MQMPALVCFMQGCPTAAVEIWLTEVIVVGAKRVRVLTTCLLLLLLLVRLLLELLILLSSVVGGVFDDAQHLQQWGCSVFAPA